MPPMHYCHVLSLDATPVPRGYRNMSGTRQVRWCGEKGLEHNFSAPMRRHLLTSISDCCHLLPELPSLIFSHNFEEKEHSTKVLGGPTLTMDFLA